MNKTTILALALIGIAVYNYVNGPDFKKIPPFVAGNVVNIYLPVALGAYCMLWRR